MESVKLMPDPLDLREVVFTNLLLLGFNVEAYENKTRIQFSRDMFSLPNRKAMEIVVHFLFGCLNKNAAKQTFKTCWPITDKKREQEFTKIIVDWLTKIRREKPDAHLPTIVRSLFLSPSGEKFYRFLFYFSTYVLKEKTTSLKGNALTGKGSALPIQPFFSNQTKKFVQQTNQSLKTQILLKHNELISFIEKTEKTQDISADYFRELSKEHYRLNKQKRDLEKQMNKLVEQMEYILGKRTISSKDKLRRMQNLKKIESSHGEIKTMHDAHQTLQAKIESILSQSGGQHRINGTEIDLKVVPKIIVRECEQQLRLGKKIKNIFEGGKVNLNSLVDLWKISLMLIEEIQQQYPLPSFQSEELFVRAQAHNHASSLEKTKDLREAISQELIPSLQSSIYELSELLKMKKEMSQEILPSMDLLPETPPFDFQNHKYEKGSELRRYIAKEKVDTPEAVNKLMSQLKIQTSQQNDVTPVRKTNTISKKVINLPSKTQHTHNQSKTPYTQAATKMATKTPFTTVPSKTPYSHLKKTNPVSSVSRRQSSKKTTMKSEKDKITEKPEIRQNVKQQRRDVSTRIPILQQGDRKTQHTKVMNNVSMNSKQDLDVVKNSENTTFNKAAHELLIDQIASSVLRSHSVGSSGASSEEDSESSKAHAIENPMEAFTEDAFMSRDKVPRTPVGKSRWTENPFQFRSPLEEITENQPDPSSLLSFNESLVNPVEEEETEERTPTISTANDDNLNELLDKKLTIDALKERYNKIKKGRNDNLDENLSQLEDNNKQPAGVENINTDAPSNSSVVNAMFSVDNIKTPSNFDELLKEEIDSNTKLFFENNKLLFSGGISPFTTPANLKTPSRKSTNDFINYITPFKSPFTPTVNTQLSAYTHDRLITPTELHFTSDEFSSSRNVTLEEVESFIDEVCNSSLARSGVQKKRDGCSGRDAVETACLISLDTPVTNFHSRDLKDKEFQLSSEFENDKHAITQFSFNDEDEI